MDSFTATTSKVEDIVPTVNEDDGGGSSGWRWRLERELRHCLNLWIPRAKINGVITDIHIIRFRRSVDRVEGDEQ
ncbi:hypothetical protein C8F04DRAFT_1392359 [Mycena alexandri]|uniref:Uncharacterized protein n=1 Tax=Mycena alexandri TaxID=1745969 RepID=A0AAD6T5E3_9AGAR|nr:hypothetical protein C8F04DRAFT_1392359 [Mycena alexandri]